MNKGFTLIELLVVVLIIGILSAVALPQYTKAVEKSRATEAITLLGNLANAEQIYKMSTGGYTNDLTLLDIQLPGVDSKTPTTTSTKNFTLTVTSANNATTFAANAVRSNNGAAITSGDNKYAILLTIDADGKITRKCQESTSSTTVTAMCKSISNGSSTGEIK